MPKISNGIVKGKLNGISRKHRQQLHMINPVTDFIEDSSFNQEFSLNTRSLKVAVGLYAIMAVGSLFLNIYFPVKPTPHPLDLPHPRFPHVTYRQFNHLNYLDRMRKLRLKQLP
jgi:hypothetical protein